MDAVPDDFACFGDTFLLLGSIFLTQFPFLYFPSLESKVTLDFFSCPFSNPNHKLRGFSDYNKEILYLTELIQSKCKTISNSEK